MKIFIDTNVIVSGLLAKGLCTEILEDIVYSHTPFVSAFIIQECEYVFSKKFKLSKETTKTLLTVVDTHFVQSETSSIIQDICRDKNDNQVLADALLAKADIILSGDKDLLSLETYETIKIISPKKYWKM